MSKTVVIGGVCRSGKSRLANKVFNDRKVTVFHGDHLNNILCNLFPDRLTEVERQKILIKLIKNMGKEFNYIRVFESCLVEPLLVKQKLHHLDYLCLFLGYPQVNVNKKLQEIRDYAAKHPHCWSHQYNDRTMISYIKHFAKISRQQKQKCEMLGIKYFDTSENFQQTWDDAYNYIVNFLQSFSDQIRLYSY